MQGGPSPGHRARLLWLLVIVALLAGSATWGVASVGHWPVVEDTLERADAVLVLADDLPFRAMGAAAIYEQRWAPEVWLTIPSDPAQEAALAPLAIRVFREDFYVVVTSKPHTRRVRATWHALFPDLDLRVRYPANDPYTADGWWRGTRDALAVSREVFGILNVWAGSRSKPDRNPGEPGNRQLLIR